jgi:hypothetical protein
LGKTLGKLNPYQLSLPQSDWTWQDQAANLLHARSSHDSESSIFINDPKQPGLQLLRAAKNVAGNDKGRLKRIGHCKLPDAASSRISHCMIKACSASK